MEKELIGLCVGKLRAELGESAKNFMLSMTEEEMRFYLSVTSACKMFFKPEALALPMLPRAVGNDPFLRFLVLFSLRNHCLVFEGHNGIRFEIFGIFDAEFQVEEGPS